MRGEKPITCQDLAAAIRGALANKETVPADDIRRIVHSFEKEAERQKKEAGDYERKLLFGEIRDLRERVDALTAPRHVKAAKFIKNFIQQADDSHLILAAWILALQAFAIKYAKRE